MNNKFEIITLKERSKFIIEELGDRIEVKPYDSESDLIVFKDLSNFDLVVLFHTGIRYGHDRLAKAFGY